MVIVQLRGGLGNQMFQYAAGRALSCKWQEQLLLDTSIIGEEVPNVDKRSFALKCFKNIQPKLSSTFLTQSFYMHTRWDNRLRKIAGMRMRKSLKETSHSYNSLFGSITPPVLLQGYWQSERYFSDYADTIRQDFQFPDLNPKDKNYSFLHDILGSESISVHVRRGDYVKYGAANMFSGICDLSYYQRAIKYFQDNTAKPKFYFFSEDPDWIQENLLAVELDGTMISGNSDENSWKDMCLMSRCKHHIVANSSFSWWGAWLNPDVQKKVIAPVKWFNTDDVYYEPNEVVPSQWMRM